MLLPSPFRSLITGLSLALAAAACRPDSTDRAANTIPEADASGLPPGFRPGPWRGVLSAQGQQIPFLFDVSTADNNQKPTVTLRNGEERLVLDEITTAGDSTTIRLGVFDAALVVRADGEGKLRGAWVKYDGKEPYRVPFAAMRGGAELSPTPTRKPLSFDGTWRVTFNGNDG
ncbi:MAG: hypothetical protein H7Z21_12670, partial [Hymenobacter sp.]|nr:hypothetical protein [Hymenobacter sp.]